MNYQFRKAIFTDQQQIWTILQQAIARRKADGSNQWQDGYPNLEVVHNDIVNEYGYVLTDNETIVGYCAILINNEPEYAKIEGKWLTWTDFIVVHRVAIANNYLGRGLAKYIFEQIEDVARQHKIWSIKADTNFDNAPMLHILETLGYTYCGEVHFRGSPRKAFEKVIHP